MEYRNKIIMKTSIVGIVVNILLFLIKILIGILSNSISIISDAVNNFSDALSSIVTILGMKLALKPADKKHPYGYGRMEYISGIVVSFIIAISGFEFFKTSIDRILNPEPTNYTRINILIIVLAIGAKIFLGIYTKTKGREVNSYSLVASGVDASFDAIVSSITVISAIINLITGISLDGYIGLLMSILIMKVGLDMIKDIIDNLLGKRIDSELSRTIKSEIVSCKEILGAYDLILHNYGPTSMIGSINIELYDYVKVEEVYKITNLLQRKIYKKYGIYLTFGVYSINSENNEAENIRQSILKIINTYENVLELHGFNIDMENKIMYFDIVIDFKEKDFINLRNNIKKDIELKYLDYNVNINIDKDFAD